MNLGETQHSLPPELHNKAVAHLRCVIPSEQAAPILEAIDNDPWFHFGTGMAVRNALREVIKDAELPPVSYPQGEMRNWDDYYIPVLEEALGA